MHIRGVGNWTRKLYDFFEQEYERQQVGTARPVSRMDRLRRRANCDVIKCKI